MVSSAEASVSCIFRSTPLAELVFGVDWFALIGEDARSQGRRLARRYRASHLVVSQINASCAGLAALPRGQSDARPWCAAALLLACRYPDVTVGLVCELEADGWWMAAVHEGAVITRSDKVFASRDAAQQALDALTAFYPGLTRLDPQTAREFIGWLDDATVTACTLQRIRTGSGPRRQAAWLALMAMAGMGGVFAYVADRRPPSRLPDPLAASVTAEQAWIQAQRQALQRHWLHGSEGTAGVVQSLYRLPVHPAGWRLNSAQCVAQRTAWRCHADYSRQHLQASNQHFLRAMPSSWHISFTPLEQARAAWSIQARGRALDQSTLNQAPVNEFRLFSHLQKIRPALPRVDISAPVPLAVSAPLDEAGQPLERPADLPRYRLRNVEFHAPLRSASVLIPHAEHMGWQHIALTVAEQSRPSLVHSMFMARLKGVLYETEN